MKRHLILLTSLVAVNQILAQQSTSPSTSCAVDDVWILQMENPKCEYAVRMSALQTVTLQDYDARKDGKIQRVVEMTVETAGGNRARFFWEDDSEDIIKLSDELETKRREVQKAMEEVTGIERTDGRPRRVQKDYPTTTHSGVAEFKISTESDVRSLHTQLMQMWTGKKRNE